MADIRKELVDFIKIAIKDLYEKGNTTTHKFMLDDSFATYIGWSSRHYSEYDKYFIHSKNDSGIYLCSKLAKNIPIFADYESIKMPYFVDDGEVCDTDYPISNGEDLEFLADSILFAYKDLKRLLENREIAF